MRVRRTLAMIAASGAVVGGSVVMGSAVAGASSAGSSGGASSQAGAGIVHPRTWPGAGCTGYNLFYDWSDTGSYVETTWSICPNHTFTSGDGGAGTWKKHVKKVTLTYNVGGDAVYAGKVNAHGICSAAVPCHMTDPGSGTVGEFYAVKA